MLEGWTRWQKLALVLAALGIVAIILWYASSWLAKQGKLKPPTERQGLTSLVGVVFLPVFYWALSTRQLIPELTFLGLVSYLCVVALTELVRARSQPGTIAKGDPADSTRAVYEAAWRAFPVRLLVSVRELDA